MKKLLLVVLLFRIATVSVLAQYTSSEDVLLQQVKTEELQGEANLIATNQGKLLKHQQLAGSNVNLIQYGDHNRATLQQQGVGNTVNLTQTGVGNSYEGYLQGSNNLAEINQRGVGNQLVQDLQTNNKEYIVNQTGNQNTLIQIEKGAGAPAYRVDQIGNGMSITIQNGGLPAPIIK